jgi:hypothetical protein
VKVTETYGRMTVHCGSYCEQDESLQIIKDSKSGACMQQLTVTCVDFKEQVVPT